MLVAIAPAPPVLDLPEILTPLNIVWLELIVHSVSVLVFEGRDSGEDVMSQRPRNPNQSIVSMQDSVRSGLC